MPRIRERHWRYEPTITAALDLMMGPTDAPGELTLDELAVAWEIERDFLMEECRSNPNPGWRLRYWCSLRGGRFQG